MSARRRSRVVIPVDFRAHAALRSTTPASATAAVTPSAETPALVVPLRRPVDEQRAHDLFVQASAIDEQPKRYDEAELLYRRAIAADPTYSVAYVNLGNIRYRRGDEPAALALYDQALVIDPRQPDAYYNIGHILLERGDARAAVERFEQAVFYDPRFAAAYFNMAMACERLGDYEKAARHWDLCLKLEPTGTWADVARGHLQTIKKDEDKRRRVERLRQRASHVKRPAPAAEAAGAHLPGMDEWLAKQRRP